MLSSKIRVIALAAGIALCASACTVSVERDRDDDDKTTAAPAEVTQQDSQPATSDSPTESDSPAPSDSASAADTQQPVVDGDDDSDDWDDVTDSEWQDALNQATTVVQPDPTGALAVQNEGAKVRVDEDLRELQVQAGNCIVVVDEVQDVVVSGENVKVYAKKAGTVTFLGGNSEVVWKEGSAPVQKMDGGVGNSIRQAQ